MQDKKRPRKENPGFGRGFCAIGSLSMLAKHKPIPRGTPEHVTPVDSINPKRGINMLHDEDTAPFTAIRNWSHTDQ